MLNKLFRAVVCLLCVLCLTVGTFSASATDNEQTIDEARSFIDGIVAFKLKQTETTSVQQWIEDSLTDNAGSTSEWYIIALSQMGEYDLSHYKTALLNYLKNNEVHSASSRQKYALALTASGSTDEYINQTVNDSIGQQGVMSWVYGLHLLNNGYSSEEYSIDDVKEMLVSLQLDDGGWAVMGEVGDVDVTAMTIQALAPHYGDPAVNSAVDKALELLGEQQQASGDYLSYGVGNPESTAQVLVALSSLGIDCTADNRFIKNGNTLFDGIRNYQLPDGSFCHKLGGEYNETATTQVFFSMVAYERMKNGDPSLYVFDINDDDKTAETDTSSEFDEKITTQPAKTVNYKLWVSFGITLAAVAACIVLFILKKRNKMNFITIFIIAAVLVCIVLVTDFQSTDDYYGSAAETKDNVLGSVTLTIRCDTVKGEHDDNIPENGIILDVTEFEIEDGDTVYDILSEAVAKNKLHLETNGSAESVYVQGIANIYEFDFGDLSGWVYHVNGESSSVSCGEYVLSDGDKIEWHYSLNLGNDIK